MGTAAAHSKISQLRLKKGTQPGRGILSNHTPAAVLETRRPEARTGAKVDLTTSQPPELPRDEQRAMRL